MIVIGLGLALVASAALWELAAGRPKKMGVEITTETLQVGLQHPPIWIFVNDSDVNSRHWSDFMSRSSRVLNIPLLNLCYQTIAKYNGNDYRIEVIGGLQGLAEKMGGWDALPQHMRNPRARVTEPEEDWIRSAVLSKWGGLWLSPSVVCMKPFGKLPEDRIVFFGQDSGPMYGSAVPGFRAVWAPMPNMPLFKEWERRCRARLETQLGGRQFRGDAKSDWVDLTHAALQDKTIEVRVLEELGRDSRTNKTLDLELLFAAGTEGRLPFEVPECVVYVPIPYNDLLDRRMFGWILRSSEEQILSSDIAIKYILLKAIQGDPSAVPQCA